ncbi:hypothetical protein MKEN_00716200 [Mycena kentingensis (nom. inval.)]|nr:hypothetical protein MKEN_00716200 [Mycena kentingensis (nom. inval.)]
MVTFDVDVAPEGAVTPDIGTVAMPVPALGNPNNALPALEMDLRPLPESEPAQLVIAQPRPIVANTQPPPVISEPEQPEMTQAQLPLYAPKPSRVPIAVGALEYYQKRQQLGMMQTGPVGGQHGRNASQSTVASLAAGVMVGGPPGIAMGGQVVMAQGRDHPFPLQSQRNADAALPMTPTTPRTMMMVKERNQATLDALDLDLNLVLGSLEARAQEDMAGTPMTIPLDIPEQVEVSRVSIQSVDDLRRTGEETPAEAGVGLAFYVSSLSPDVETLPQSAPASPIAEKSNLLPPKQVATEPVIIVKEPIPTLLKPPKNEQKQRSSIAVAKLATFPTVPSRSRTPTSSRAVTPTPSVLSNSTESSQASSDRPDFRSQPANPQRSRSQTHARKMNQFPVTPTRSRVQTPTSSRAPTPTMSVTSSSDDDIRARTVAHRRSRSAGQMQMLRPNLVFAGPRPPSVAGSDASSSGPVVGSRQRSKSLTRRPNQAPSRPQSPTASVAGSLTSELSTRQRPSAHERTKSLRTNEFALAPPPGSAPAPAQAPKVPILSPTLSAVSDFIGPKHKRNKSQPRTLLPPPAVDISAPLSPGAIELEEERAQRKKLSRFSDG